MCRILFSYAKLSSQLPRNWGHSTEEGLRREGEGERAGFVGINSLVKMSTSDIS